MKITITLTAERPAAREHSSGRAILQNTISERLEIDVEQATTTLLDGGRSDVADPDAIDVALRVVKCFLKTARKRFAGEHAAAFDRAILDRQGSRPADVFDIEHD